jgi:hypothetical protein
MKTSLNTLLEAEIKIKKKLFGIEEREPMEKQQKIIEWSIKRNFTHKSVFMGDSHVLTLKSGLKGAHLEIEFFLEGSISLSVFPTEMESVLPKVDNLEAFELPNLIETRFGVMEKILSRKECFDYLALSCAKKPCVVTYETALITLTTPVKGLELTFFWNVKNEKTQSVKLFPGFEAACALQDEDIEILSNIDRLFHILLTKYDVLSALQIIFDRMAIQSTN